MTTIVVTKTPLGSKLRRRPTPQLENGSRSPAPRIVPLPDSRHSGSAYLSITNTFPAPPLQSHNNPLQSSTKEGKEG